LSSYFEFVKISRMKHLYCLFFLFFFPNLTFADWYIGISGGQSDYSDFTIEDLELSALNITKNDDKDFAFNLYLGKELNDYFNYEIGYLNIGKRLIDGNISGATLSTEQKMQGISTSILLKKEVFDGFTPYFRFGLVAGITDIKTNKGGNAQSVFQNPNNEKASIFGLSSIVNVSGLVEKPLPMDETRISYSVSWKFACNERGPLTRILFVGSNAPNSSSSTSPVHLSKWYPKIDEAFNSYDLKCVNPPNSSVSQEILPPGEAVMFISVALYSFTRRTALMDASM